MAQSQNASMSAGGWALTWGQFYVQLLQLPKEQKIQSVFFRFLGSVSVKAAHKIFVGEIDTCVNFKKLLQKARPFCNCGELLCQNKTV